MIRNFVLRMSIKTIIRTPTPRNIRNGYPILSSSWNPPLLSPRHQYFATYAGDRRRGTKYNNTNKTKNTSNRYKETLKHDLIKQLKSCRHKNDRNKIPNIMVELHPLLQNPQDWMPVLGAYISVRDLAAAYKIFDKMRTANCEPNVFIYSKLITAYVRVNRLDNVQLLRNEMNKYGVKPNIFTYATLLKAYSNNVQEVEKLCNEMQDNNVKPNVIFNNTLMTAHIGDVEKVEDIFQEIKYGYEESLFQEDFQPNEQTYGTVMQANIHNVKRVEEIFEEMKENGITPDVITYNTRMKANSNDVERVEEIWKEMKENGIQPNVVNYNTLMHAHIDDTERVEELLKEMKDKGIPPDEKTYITISTGYSKIGNFHKCRELVELAEKAGIDINLRNRR